MKKLIFIPLLFALLFAKAQTFTVQITVVKINNVYVKDTVYLNFNKIVSITQCANQDSVLISYEVANKSGLVTYKTNGLLNTVMSDINSVYPKFFAVEIISPNASDESQLAIFNSDYVSEVISKKDGSYVGKYLFLSTQTPKKIRVKNVPANIISQINTTLYNFTHQF